MRFIAIYWIYSLLFVLFTPGAGPGPASPHGFALEPRAAPQQLSRDFASEREGGPGGRLRGGVASTKRAGPRCALGSAPSLHQPVSSRDVISWSLAPVRPPGPSSPPRRFQRRPARPPSPPLPASPSPRKIPKRPPAASGALSPSPFAAFDGGESRAEGPRRQAGLPGRGAGDAWLPGGGSGAERRRWARPRPPCGAAGPRPSRPGMRRCGARPGLPVA